MGPPLNPAKKWGSTKPSVMRMSDSTQCRLRKDRYAIDGWGGGDEGVGIETVVADDLIVLDNLGPKHPFEFLTGVGSVSAGGNQDGYPVLGN